jgi:hypothetical protein
MSAMVVRGVPVELAWRMPPSKLSVWLPSRSVWCRTSSRPAHPHASVVRVPDHARPQVCLRRGARVVLHGSGSRLVARRPVPALLVFACLGITMRTSIYLCSANTFMYVVQPIPRTLATAAMLAGFVVIGPLLIARSPPSAVRSAPRSEAGRPWCDCSNDSPTSGWGSTPRPRS